MPDQATIIDKARQITGNKMDNAVGETFIPDDAIAAAIAPAVRDLNTIYGTATGLKEFTFTATPGVQDYDLQATLGADVYEVMEVIRSAAYLADGLLGDEIDPQTGLRFGNSAIPQGYQGDAMDVILAQWRKRRTDAFDWEVVNNTTLRLMPAPMFAEAISVRYVTSAYTIDTLPANTESVLLFAACVAILNGIINRINSSRQTTDTYGQAQTERLNNLVSQRDYYQGAFEKEFGRLAG
ncbi:MAG: hypothetical protein ACM359_17200 [Bacillota bacterium]